MKMVAKRNRAISSSDATSDKGTDIGSDESDQSTAKDKQDKTLTDFFPRHQSNRCPDWHCLAVFATIGVCWLGVSTYGLIQGDANKVSNPTATNGEVCGADAAKERPQLLYFDILTCAPESDSKNQALNVDEGGTSPTTCRTPQACVHECPVRHMSEAENPDDLYRYCIDNIISTQGGRNESDGNKTLKDYIEDGRCPRRLFASTVVMHRCLPVLQLDESSYEEDDGDWSNAHTRQGRNSVANISKEMLTTAGKAATTDGELTSGLPQKLIYDLHTGIELVLKCSVFAAGLAVAWALLAGFFPAMTVWLTTFAFDSCLGYSSWYCYHQVFLLRHSPLEGNGEVIIVLFHLPGNNQYLIIRKLLFLAFSYEVFLNSSWSEFVRLLILAFLCTVQ